MTTTNVCEGVKMMKTKLIFVALAGLAFASTSCFFYGSPETYTSAGQQQVYQEPYYQESYYEEQTQEPYYQESYYEEQTVVTTSAGGIQSTAEAGPLGSSATVVGPNGEVISVSVSMSGMGGMGMMGMMEHSISMSGMDNMGMMEQMYDNSYQQQEYDNSYQQQQVVQQQGGHHHHGGRGSRGGGCYAMGIVDFSKYYDTMKAKNFDSHKVDQAKLSARSGACFEVDQIVKLLQLLSFDANRVEMAVALYPITADPQNWYRLANAFQFQSNYQEVVEQTIGN